MFVVKTHSYGIYTFRTVSVETMCVHRLRYNDIHKMNK